MGYKQPDITKDWRGVDIEIGSPVIYGATVGRSVELVEGKVVGFTSSGRVNVEIIRRAYNSGSTYSKSVVHIGNDRITVVNPDSLPPSTLKTYTEEAQAAKDEKAERDANYASHHVATRTVPNTFGNWTRYDEEKFCTVCGIVGYDMYGTACA